jgi:hypothetical protein
MAASDREFSTCGRMEPAEETEPAMSGLNGVIAKVTTVVEANLISGIAVGTIVGGTCPGAIVFELSAVFFSADFPRPATAATSSCGVAGAAVPAVCKASAKLLGLCPVM